ncbi:uncharacterized protein LOC142974214 [Anticarsia gemmatalis]|uniref:uncharacterized protein LOC142974214 n=1 Tax=Anticarsia gemmatalis TaxID=129554 RepID=UPI003F76C03B
MKTITTILSVIILFAAQCSATKTAQVQVQQGALAGELLELVTGDGQYYSFKGIPYAQPPVGELRFKAPLPASSWDGVRDATQHGSMCPHINIVTNEFVSGDEDCLFLNVYSPNLTPESPLSVIFFIHGGGYISGSGNVDKLGPDFLMRQNIVLVTFNYRLAALGFLSLGTEEVPGNAALKDQVLALKWVNDNIQFFGGDPKKITIMGQSAGGAAVGFHLASPMSKGLFHRAIALSGSPYCDWAMAYQPERRAFKLGKQLGFETRDPAALHSFLLNVSSDAIVNHTNPDVLAAEEIIVPSIICKQYQFAPVIEKFHGENNFLSENLFNSTFQHASEVDILFGHTNEEGLGAFSLPNDVLFEPYDEFVEMFTPRKILDSYEPNVVLEVGSRIRDHYFGSKSINENAMRQFVSFAGDAYINYDVVKYFALFPNKAKKYMYKFSGESSRNVYGQQGIPYGIFGVGHNDDVSSLFDEKARNLSKPIGKDLQIIDNFTTAIKNFVENGNPGLSLNVNWPEFNLASMKYGDISTTVCVSSLKEEKLIPFWETLYLQLYFQSPRSIKIYKTWAPDLLFHCQVILTRRMEIPNIIIVISLLAVQCIATDTVQVQVQQGALAGELLELVTGEGQYYSFKGIPYAQPPVGELRFKAPQPASSWEGVRNASEHGSVCPQKDILTEVFIPGDEDCLFLNVYSPNVTSDACLPVLFFIHGGGFKSGSGNVDSFGPDFFIRKDIVLVTINYRLDALGFLSLGTEEVPGNAGLKDQVLALKWVQQNIKYFGGDPTKVTIMGQSAGGASVGFHLASPMSTGLFHRAIALSGSPYCDWALSYHPETRAFKLGKQFGYETQNTSALLSFLQTVGSDQFVNYTNPNVLASEEITSVITKEYQFPPVVEQFFGENNFISENLLSTNFSHVNKADVLFGYTNQEGVTALAIIKSVLLARYDAFIENFASRKVANHYAPDIVLKVGAKVRDHYFGNESISEKLVKEFVSYVNEANFDYDIVRYFSQFPNEGRKYMYQFSSESSRNEYGSQGAQYGIFGAGHIDDLSNMFDPKSRNLTLDMNSNEFKIIDRFTTLIANFVKCGNPTPDSSFNVTWPEFDSTSMNYMDIGTYNLTVSSLTDESYYNFFETLFESVGLIY